MTQKGEQLAHRNDSGTLQTVWEPQFANLMLCITSRMRLHNGKLQNAPINIAIFVCPHVTPREPRDGLS
jgi:hypothetical protein